MRGEREGGREGERGWEGERETKSEYGGVLFSLPLSFLRGIFRRSSARLIFFLLLNSFRKKRRSYSEISSTEDSLLKGEISTTEVQLIGDLLG